MHGLLICRTPLTALVHATPVGSGSERLLYLPCGAGLGPCALLLNATSEHERPAAVAAIACTTCVQQVQRGARDVHGLLIAGGVGPCPLLCALLLQLIKSKRCSADCRTHGLGALHSAVAAKACCI